MRVSTGFHALLWHRFGTNRERAQFATSEIDDVRATFSQVPLRASATYPLIVNQRRADFPFIYAGYLASVPSWCQL